jgi:hypothetical protein
MDGKSWIRAGEHDRPKSGKPDRTANRPGMRDDLQRTGEWYAGLSLRLPLARPAAWPD